MAEKTEDSPAEKRDHRDKFVWSMGDVVIKPKEKPSDD